MIIDILTWLATHPVQAFFILLLQFIVFMKIHHKFHHPVLHSILGIIFTPQNMIVNATFISMVGLELPQEYTTTARMKRWKRLEGYTGIKKWRWTFATKLCDILNKYDVGHC
jgi:hypothetical protein